MQKTWYRTYPLLIVLFVSFSLIPTVYSKNNSQASAGPSVVLIEPGGIQEQVLEVFNKFMNQSGKSVTNVKELSPDQLKKAAELMTALYVTADKGGDAHGTVALLIKKGLKKGALSKDFKKNKKNKWRKIPKKASQFMARAREQMIEGTMFKVIGEPSSVGLEDGQKLHIARSDTGNPDSGMRSDLDQTFFVYSMDPETGAKTRRPELDQKFLDAFESKWKADFGELSLKMLDVVSIKGSAQFPDPRFISIEGFTSAFHRAAGDLRNLEGAYISPSAIAQQVHKRQYETLTGIVEADSVRNPNDPPSRVWQEYGEGVDGKAPGKILDPDYNFAIREMIGGTPELTPQAGFSAAIANWMMLQHSFKGNDFNVKYHLRTFDDAVYVKILQEQGGGMKQKAEYSAMTPAQRQLIAEEAMARLFPDDVNKQKHHKIAMDISAEMRNQHTGTSNGKPGGSKKGSADYEIYRPMLEDLYGKNFKPDDTSKIGKARLQTQLDATKAYHKELASEFCIKSAQTTAPDAFKAMQGGNIIDDVRPFFEVEGRSWDETRVNIMEGARLTLLYGIYDLGPAEGLELMKKLEIEIDGATRWDLAKLYMEAQVLPFKAYYNNPESYNRAITVKVSELAEGARMHALSEWGFKNVEEFEAVGALLKKQKMIWSPHQLAKNMFWDMGSVASIAQVAEVFVTSKGDWNKVVAKAMDEVLLAVPVVGQLENLRRGGVEGAVLLGPILYFPPLGKVMVAYNIAKSIHVIADFEYLKPRRNNAADMVYRGFAGPATRAYGEPGAPPPIWTPAMQKEYDDKENRLGEAKAWVYVLENPRRDDPMDAYPIDISVKTIDQAKEELKAAQIEFDQIDGIYKRWIEFRDGNWAGGFWSGGGAVLNQIWMEKSLLEDKVVEPVIGFFTGGVVDLRVDYDPRTYSAMLKEYEKGAKNGAAIEAQLRSQALIVNLNNRKKKWERAQKYKDKITLKKDMKIADKEMRIRFLRDSVYANIKEKRIDMDTWVNVYFKEYEKKLYRKLRDANLIEPAKTMRHMGKGEYVPIPEDQIVYIHHEIRDLVRERLQRDYERSMRLLIAYKLNLKHVKEEQERIIKEQVVKYQNQGFAKAKAHYSEQESFKLFMNTLRLSYVKRKAPKVKMTFFKTQVDNEIARKGKPGGFILEPYETDLQVNIQLDHHLYKPRYRARVVELTAKQATSPPDKVNGVPIQAETKKAIQDLVGKHKDRINKGEVFIAVGTVSCESVQSLKGVDPKTYHGLPGYENGVAAKGEVVIGQQVQAIETKPFTVKVDPIHIEVVDAADQLVSDHNCQLTIGQETIRTDGGKYDLVHEFTTYDEEIEIVAKYSLSQENVITGTAKVSINDIESWVEPSLPDIIKIKLPVLMPGSVGVKGLIKLKELPNSGGVNDRAVVKSGSLGVSGLIGIPGEKPGASGRFEFQSRKPIKTGESINVFAKTSGHIEKKLASGKIERIAVPYAGTKTIAAPLAGGMINLGEITMTGKVKLVKVPEFDRTRPMPYKTYVKMVEQAGLRPKTTMVDPHEDPEFSHSIKETNPTAGSMVPPGSDVAIQIYRGSERLVPDVVNFHIKKATDLLKDKDIIVKSRIIRPPPRPNKEFTIITQSIKPDTPYKPGLELHVEIYGRAADMVIAVPDLKDMTITKAIEETQKVGLQLNRDPSNEPAPDLRHEGLIYQQKPAPGAKVNPSQRVTAWIYGKKGSGGEAEGLGEATGPYYVVFGMNAQTPAKSSGKLNFPKKGEDESKEAFQNRIRVFVNSIPFNQLQIMPVPPEKMVLPFHVTGAGLQRYPRKMFLPGSKAAAKIYFKNTKAKPGDLSALKGTLLLNVLGIYGSKDEVVENYPKAKETKQFSSLTLNTAAGTARMQQEGNDITLGPITSGWTQKDLQDSWNFWKELYIALGQLSCFVSTVSYPDQNDSYFVSLRQFRDQVLVKSTRGKRLVDLYYRHGPALAAFVVDHDLQPHSRKFLNLLGRMVDFNEDVGLLQRLLLKTSIETAGRVLPTMETVLLDSEERSSKGLKLNSRLPQSMVIDVLTGKK